MYPKRETTSARLKTHRVWQRTHSWWCTGWALHATSQVTDLIDKNDVTPVRKRQSFTTGTKNKKAFVPLDEKLEALVLRKPAATSYQKADWCPRTLSFSFLTITGLQRLTVWTTDGIWRGEPNGVWYTKGGKWMFRSRFSVISWSTLSAYWCFKFHAACVLPAFYTSTQVSV